jgi:hypothetical protein
VDTRLKALPGIANAVPRRTTASDVRRCDGSSPGLVTEGMADAHLPSAPFPPRTPIAG